MLLLNPNSSSVAIIRQTLRDTGPAEIADYLSEQIGNDCTGNVRSHLPDSEGIFSFLFVGFV